MPVFQGEGGPCHNCESTETRAAAWATDHSTGYQFCHLRGCLRAGGFLPPLGSSRKRYMEPAPVGEMPGLPSNVKLLVCEEVLGQRYIDVSKMSAEALRSEVAQDAEVPQWLVSGKFGTGSRRDRGFYTITWLDDDKLLENGGDELKESVKAQLTDYKRRVVAEIDETIKLCDQA